MLNFEELEGKAKMVGGLGLSYREVFPMKLMEALSFS